MRSPISIQTVLELPECPQRFSENQGKSIFPLKGQKDMEKCFAFLSFFQTKSSFDSSSGGGSSGGGGTVSGNDKVDEIIFNN